MLIFEIIYSLMIWILNLGSGGANDLPRHRTDHYIFSKQLVKELKNKCSKGYEQVASIANVKQINSIINTLRYLIFNQEKNNKEISELRGILNELAPSRLVIDPPTYKLENINDSLINKPYIYVKSVIEYYIENAIVVKMEYGDSVTVAPDIDQIELIVDKNDNVIQIQNSL